SHGGGRLMGNRGAENVQGSRSGFATTVGLALLLVLGATLLWAPSAHAQAQCAALMSITPDVSPTCTAGVCGPPGALTAPGGPAGTVHLTVRIANGCTDAGGNPANAVVKGTTVVDVACKNANNLTAPNACLAGDQLGALAITGCVGAAAGINCSFTAGG